MAKFSFASRLLEHPLSIQECLLKCRQIGKLSLLVKNTSFRIWQEAKFVESTIRLIEILKMGR